MGILSENIGIDPGTASVRIFMKGKGIVLDEPCLAVVDKSSEEVVAAGLDAEKLIGKIPDSFNTIYPIKRGVIHDYNAAEGMFRALFDKCLGRRVIKPRVLVAVSSDCTDVHKRAMEEALLSAGAKSVSFKNKSLAAAVGAGLDIKDISGNLIIDIGCGTANIAVISIGTVVACRTVNVAGNDFVEAIIHHIKNKYGVTVGYRAAGEIKSMLAGNDVSHADGYIVVGRDVLTGLPRSVKVLIREVKDAVGESIMALVSQIRSVIEVTPDELVADIMSKGAVLTGRGALLPELLEIVSKQLNMPVVLADNPADSVIFGLGKAISKEYDF